jgi:hypothetical protein
MSGAVLHYQGFGFVSENSTSHQASTSSPARQACERNLGHVIDLEALQLHLYMVEDKE